MSDAAEPAVIYLEPDDEITTVVRRLRETDASRVILVAPGRTKATTSAMGLRLLAGVARDEGRELVLVADPAARSLAIEAGIAATSSVAEARALRDVAAVAAATPRSGARISVARGPRRAAIPPPPAPTGSLDETRSVPVVPPVAGVRGARPRSRRRFPIASLAALGLLLVLAVGAGAVLLPGATVRLAPVTEPIGPFDYELETGPDLELHEITGEEPATAAGTASGIREERVQATGVVTLQNWNTVAIAAGAGTQVAAGDIVFTTNERVVVPPGGLTPEGTIAPGTEDVGVTAVDPGPQANVAAEAINRMITEPTASLMRGFPNSQLRVVINAEATAGGAAEEIPVIQQADVDAALASLQGELDAMVAAARIDAGTRLYLDPIEGEIAVDVGVPDDLVGREGETAFELAGTLRWSLHWLERDAIETLARQRLAEDPAATSEGRDLLPDASSVTVDPATRDAGGATIPVHVTGATAPHIDEDAIRALVADKPRAEAVEALASIGPARIDLWPGWVDRVPGLTWRISVELEGAIEASPSASP